MEHETFLSKVNELSNNIELKLAEQKEKREEYNKKFAELKNEIISIFSKFDLTNWEVRTKSGALVYVTERGLETDAPYLTDEDFEDIQESTLKVLEIYYENIS